jgi:transposase
MSRHSIRGGNSAGLLDQLARLREKAQARTGKTLPIIVIQEAGLDGFWLHRVLEREGIESHHRESCRRCRFGLDLASATRGEDGSHRW